VELRWTVAIVNSAWIRILVSRSQFILWKYVLWHIHFKNLRIGVFAGLICLWDKHRYWHGQIDEKVDQRPHWTIYPNNWRAIAIYIWVWLNLIRHCNRHVWHGFSHFGNFMLEQERDFSLTVDTYLWKH